MFLSRQEKNYFYERGNELNVDGKCNGIVGDILQALLTKADENVNTVNSLPILTKNFLKVSYANN